MKKIRIFLAAFLALRQLGKITHKHSLAQDMRREAQQTGGMTWEHFDRDSLQPRSTLAGTIVLIISIILFLANVILVASLAYPLGDGLIEILSTRGLIVLGLFVVISYGHRNGTIETNAIHAKLIRKLDAGEYVPWPDRDGTGGGS
jgi:hypothetical protein